MGRPIKSKYFGNRNYPYDNEQTGGTTGVGGEGVASIVVNNSGTGYTTSTTLNLSFTAPQITGGILAAGTVVTNGTGKVSSVTLSTTGSGYTVLPTATVVGGTAGTTATFTIALSTSFTNAISFTSYLSTGTSAVAGGDVIKQESTRRYLVRNSQGRGKCKLVATSTLVPGTMNIVATDYSGATYFVTKLTSRKATLINRTSTSTSLVPLVSNGTVVTGRTGWTLGAATGTIVTIANA